MNITKVTYQKAFVIGPYLQEKIGIEIEIDTGNGETPEGALNKAKEIVEVWHLSNQPNNHIAGPQLAPSTELPVINKEHERLEMLIENAKAIEELMGYKNNLSTPKLADLFWSKHEQLALIARNK